MIEDVEEDRPECLLEINEPNWGIVGMPNLILLSQLHKLSSSNHFQHRDLNFIMNLTSTFDLDPTTDEKLIKEKALEKY